MSSTRCVSQEFSARKEGLSNLTIGNSKRSICSIKGRCPPTNPQLGIGMGSPRDRSLDQSQLDQPRGYQNAHDGWRARECYE